MIRMLTVLVGLAALAWSGWWVVGRNAALSGIEAGIVAAEAQGWTIAYDDLGVAGFPNRFDTTATDLSVATPEGWGLTAPFLQVFALSYRPNHVIAVAPHEMRVATPAGAAEIRSDDLRASAVTSPSRGEIDRATVTAEALTLDGRGWTVGLSSGQVAVRQAGGPETYEIAAGLSDIRPGGPAWEAMPPGPLPARIGAVRLDALVMLDGPAIAGATPSFRSVDLRSLSMGWDGVRLDLSGPIRVDSDGLPSGSLTLRAEGWRDLLGMAVAAGFVTGVQEPLLAAGLGGLSQPDGSVEIPVVLRGGVISLAGFPLGPIF